MSLVVLCCTVRERLVPFTVSLTSGEGMRGSSRGKVVVEEGRWREGGSREEGRGRRGGGGKVVVEEGRGGKVVVERRGRRRREEET